jgi:hypothetical protein
VAQHAACVRDVEVAEVVFAQVGEPGDAERRRGAGVLASLARGVDHLGVDVDAEPVADA